MIELHRHEGVFGIVTDASDAEEFSNEFAQALAEIIERNAFGNDTENMLERWLPHYAEIVIKLRGYKSNAVIHSHTLSDQMGARSPVVIAKKGTVVNLHYIAAKAFEDQLLDEIDNT